MNPKKIRKKLKLFIAIIRRAYKFEMKFKNVYNYLNISELI